MPRAMPDRLCVEYAPSGRAACKKCNAAIEQDTVKLGEKVRNPLTQRVLKSASAPARCWLRVL